MVFPDDNRHIRATADDVLRAKHATVQAGYYADPFIQSFYGTAAEDVARSSTPGVTVTAALPRYQVQPMIKRGTYARVCVIDRAIATFLNNCGQENGGGTSGTGTDHAVIPQIVILGAGKDTLFFRLHNGDLTSAVSSHFYENVRWYEVDHEDVLDQKVSAIQRSRHCFLPDGNETIVPRDRTGWHLVSPRRHCRWIPHDLRNDPSELVQELDLDVSAPILFIMECVQMYLPIRASRSILRTLRETYPRSTLCCYEPILQSDAFGRMMETNLIQAGIVVQDQASVGDSSNNHTLVDSTGLLCLRTTDDHLRHLTTDVGFATATACDMWSAHETIVTASQRQHAHRCEFLDELEEFMLIMRHYCFVIATSHHSGGMSEQLTLTTKSEPDVSKGKNTETWSTTHSFIGFVTGRCTTMKR